MAKAQGLAETLAGEVLDEATYRNTELWNEYPDLHDLTYTVDKNGKAKAELVKRYGSWTESVAEARRHGVKLRQAEGYRDGNPAEQYEAIVNDTRAMGGVKESAAALFRSAAQEAGVAGAASMESTEWLDVLMNVHDTIKPKMMSRFADAAEYEDAKVELAGRMIGDIMSHPEMTDAEAVFEGILKHNREVAAMAAGSEERAAEVTKGLKSVQQAQRKAFADRMRENSRSQSAEVKSVSRAERQLNENLETLGAQVSTAAGLDEKMTALREAYEPGMEGRKEPDEAGPAGDAGRDKAGAPTAALPDQRPFPAGGRRAAAGRPGGASAADTGKRDHGVGGREPAQGGSVAGKAGPAECHCH